MKEKYDTYFEKLLKDVWDDNFYEYLHYNEPKIEDIYFLFNYVNKYFFYRALWDLYMKYYYYKRKKHYDNEAEIKERKK